MRPAVIALALLLAGTALACADRTSSDPAAAAVSAAPVQALGRATRESRRYWLLLGARGWCGSHMTRYGGDAEDPGVAVVRVARFRDGRAAAAAFASLDPASLYRIFKVKMLRPPEYARYPEPLPGDESFVISYDARLPFELPAGVVIEGQMIAMRSGPFVALIENVGVPPEQIAPAVAGIVQTAEAETRTGC